MQNFATSDFSDFPSESTAAPADSNPWSTGIPDSPSPTAQDNYNQHEQRNLPPTGPTVRERSIRSENQWKLSTVLVDVGPVLNSKSLSSASRLYLNPPKAPLWSLQKDSFQRILTAWMMLATPEVDYGMRVGSLLNPKMDGLQSEIVYSPWFRDPVYIPKNKFSQILNIRGNHWITVSNWFSPDPDTVFVYDSGFANSYRHEQAEQISRLLNPTSTRIKVIFANVQQQEPMSNNCGLFSIVYNSAICKGVKPETVKINESLIRDQVADVFRARMTGQIGVESNFELRDGPFKPLGEMDIELCAKCKLASEVEAPCCRCYKRVHEECKWFDTLHPTSKYKIVKALGCKACGM